MNTINWDKYGFYGEDGRNPMISGEFHYYRVPESDWECRLQKLKECGGKMVATYIPWIIHEPQDGVFCFDDVPGRRLTAFLELCQKMGLSVVVRPGPYVYSEMVNSGLPQWLIDAHPEIMAKRANGSLIVGDGVSYVHPTFLKYAYRWYERVCDAIRPYLATNGGPIAMVQVDNELCGIHIWNASVDYNPESMGFGDENGRYARFLSEQYGSVDRLNEAYETEYRSFADADPRVPALLSGDSMGAKRCRFDYDRFYTEAAFDYLNLLAHKLVELKIDVTLCTNVGTTNLIAVYKDGLKKLPSPFLIGIDHYYTLGPWGNWTNNPTPQKFLKWVLSIDQLTEMGMAPSVLELQAGIPADFPPMLREDLTAMYMGLIAAGMRGVNYYVFTGGRNFENTGAAADIYDYNAPISYDNQVRPTYYAIKQANEFLAQNTWLQSAPRYYDVQLGMTWPGEFLPQYGECDFITERYLRDGLHFTLIGSGFQPCYRDLRDELDVSRPLVVSCGETLSADRQRALVDFIEKGGKVVIGPMLPYLDEHGNACCILRERLGVEDVRRIEANGKAELADKTAIYGLYHQFTCGKTEGAVLFGGKVHEPIANILTVGKGQVMFLGVQYEYLYQSQNVMLERLLGELGCKPTVNCSNTTLWTTLTVSDDRAMLFAVNLFSGVQESDISGEIGGRHFDLGHVTVPAMTVLPIELELK